MNSHIYSGYYRNGRTDIVKIEDVHTSEQYFIVRTVSSKIPDLFDKNLSYEVDLYGETVACISKSPFDLIEKIERIENA